MFTAIVPFLDILLGTILLHGCARSRLTLREAALVSVTLATGWLVLGTELLSLFHAIDFWPVLTWWLAPLSVLLVLIATHPSRRVLRWPQLRAFDLALLVAIVAVLAWAFCQAGLSPPNNVDSQEYHLQRQVFWAQQHSVEHFATSNLRQVAMPPLTEFAGLTLMVLTGGDRYHNLVQWFALGLALCAVSLIVRRFNRSPTAQLLAALWVATIPLAFMQASSTKNDVVVLLWICVLAYWVLLLDTRSRLRWSHVALIGLVFGALVLTKGTGPIFAAPLALFAAFFLIRSHPRQSAFAFTLIVALTLAFNAGHFVRNYRAFASVASDRRGIHDGPPLANEDHSPGAILSNMVRALGSHCVIPHQAFNDKVTQLVRSFHDKLGRNIDDPHTTWVPGGRFRPYQFWQNEEDKAGAPAHLLLTLLLPLALWWRRRDIPWRAVWPLAVAAILGFGAFSFLLKWQNWHVRLIITLPALLAPVFGWCLASPRARWLAAPAALLLLVTLVPSLNSVQRPLWGPKSILVADDLMLRCWFRATEWPAPYRELVRHVDARAPKTIGFFTGASSPDYPVQRLLLEQLSPQPLLTAFNATLQIAGKPEPDPDVLLVSRSNLRRMQHNSTGTWYALHERIGRFGIFLKEPAAANWAPASRRP
jgi:hypothetical protein